MDYEALGETAQALTYYRQAQGIYEALPGEESASKAAEIQKRIKILERK